MTKVVEQSGASAEMLKNIDEGELPTVLLTLSELEKSQEWLDRYARYISGPAPWEHNFPPAVASELRVRLASAIAEGKHRAEPDVNLVQGLMQHVAGEAVSKAQQSLLLKEMGLSEAGDVHWSGRRPPAADGFRALIIGGGVSGIAMARQLKALGLAFTLIEKSDAFGGTWHENTYPGCGVDIASHYFSYSFWKKPDWTRYYAKQPEILAYIQAYADGMDLHANTRFGTTVESARWIEESAQWEVFLRRLDGQSETVYVDILISATGLLHFPNVPRFEGMSSFRGTVLHAAQWEPGTALEGKRVGLIGSGASANQIGPAIAPVVRQLTVFQRTAHWNIGVPNYMHQVSPGEIWLLRNVPAYERWFRARTLLSQNDTNRAAQIVDPEWGGRDGAISQLNAQVREALTDYIKKELGERQDLLPQALPDYPPFSKRMLRDNGWYRMLRRSNVELVPAKSLSFYADGIVDQNGAQHALDVVVLATGFEASKMLASFDLYGRGGTSIRELWGDDDPRAFKGMAVAGFPNFFVMFGPNTNIATGGSIISQAENWSRYIAEAVKTKVEQNVRSLEVMETSQAKYNEVLDQRLATMVWSVSSADTWYRNKKGRVTTNMPWTSLEYWEMTKTFDAEAYHFRFNDAAAD